MRLVLACPLLLSLGVLVGCGGADDDGAADAQPANPAPGGMRGGGGAIMGGMTDAAVDLAVDGRVPPPDMRAPDVTMDVPPVDVGAPDGRVDMSVPDAPRDLPAPDAPPVDTRPASDGQVCGAGGSCEAIAKEYTLALPRARTCNTLLKAQCQYRAPSSLTCGCPTWVNSTTELDMIRGRWVAAGCERCAWLCPAILCRALTSGTCLSRAPVDEVTTSALTLDIIPPVTTAGTCANAAVIAPAP